jgi:hypothetical protein
LRDFFVAAQSLGAAVKISLARFPTLCYFTATRNTRLKEGFMDLLIRRPAGMVEGYVRYSRTAKAGVFTA